MLAAMISHTSLVNANESQVIHLKNEPLQYLGSFIEVLPDKDDALSPFLIALPEWDEAWTPYNEDILNLGYDPVPHWIRLKVDASASIHKQWDLVISTSALDYVDIYQIFEETGPRLVYRSGMKRSFANRIEDHRFFIVPLKIFNEPGKPTEFMIRIETVGSFYAPMQLYPSGDFWSPLQKQDIFNWMFYGIILAMALYNLFLYSSVRDSAYLYYVFFITSFALLHLSLDGYIFQHFWPFDQGYSYALDTVFSLMTALFGFLFLSKFMELKDYLPRLNLLIIVLALLQIPIIFAAIYYHQVAFDSWTMFPLGTMLALAVIVGIYAAWKGLKTARYFLVAWVLFALGNAYLIAVLLGTNLFNFSPLLASKAAAFAEAMLLSFALAQRIRRLRDDREKQRLKAEAQSYFLAQVSHEIRTPLNGVLGTVELLDQTELNSEQKDYIEIIKGSGQSLLTLVGDVLDYSKIEAGKMDIQEEQVPVHELIKQQVELFRSSAAQKDLELTLHISKDVPRWIITDSHRLRQIWSNLLSNAIKFTDHGYVRVILDVIDDKGSKQLSFSVCDSGLGIPLAEQAMLFNAYQQVEIGKRRVYGGTGLGLAISKDLIELLGGTIRLESGVEKGSTFTTLLPLNAIELEEPYIVAEAHPEVGRSMKILVAEDNHVNQKVIRGLLSKLGHEIVVVHHGKEAVALRTKSIFDFDLILMDCEMPVMDGYEATIRIREFEKLQKLPPVPIVALTAHALEEIRNKCLNSGMTDFLTKPINTNKLVRTLNKY
ncbi:MAG: signal transduction histidine kinase/CheY-like chemotaxis protein [Reinekea sp.]|jgi:signal transduction histidine kinase/CheY-like chemotaxis protein